ncbi:MAG TPA: DNA-3-methyladenine glycosylase [Anaerolineaceae bacterium]
MGSRLPRSFYERSAIEVARELLGARLVRCYAGERLAGVILETEAYQGEEDLACHARAGLTPRTQVMYGAGGHAYVYFTYGVHWMFNVVTEPAGRPAAVLVRAIQPVEGIGAVTGLRAVPAPRRGAQPGPNGLPPMSGWTDGPGKLTQAFAISGALNGVDLCAADSELWIEPGESIPDGQVSRGPRVGIANVPEPWRSTPWRFMAQADLQK